MPVPVKHGLTVCAVVSCGAVGAHATVFRETEQFRVAAGTVAGLGGQFDLHLTPRLGVRGELARYWQSPSGGDITINWSQLRAMLYLCIRILWDPFSRARPRTRHRQR